MIKHALLTAAIVANSAAMAGPWQLKDPVDMVPPGISMPYWLETWQWRKAAWWVIGNGNEYYDYYGRFTNPYKAAMKVVKMRYDPPYDSEANFCYVSGPGRPYCIKGPLEGDDGSDPWGFPTDPIVVPSYVIESMLDPAVKSDHLLVYAKKPEDRFGPERWGKALYFEINLRVPSASDCVMLDPGEIKFFEIEIPVEQHELASIFLDFGTFSYYDNVTTGEGVWELTGRSLDGDPDIENSFAGHCTTPNQGDTHQTCMLALDRGMLEVLAKRYTLAGEDPSGLVYWELLNTNGPKAEKKQPKDLATGSHFGCMIFSEGA